MSEKEIEDIVGLFKDFLLMYKDRIYFSGNIICSYDCHLIRDNPNQFRMVCYKTYDPTILWFKLNDDLTEIISGTVKVESSVYYNNRLSKEMCLSIFKLGLDIEYYDTRSKEYKKYDRIGVMREYNLNLLING